MAFIPTVNSVKVAIQGTIAGQTWVLTLSVGTPTQPQIQDLDSINAKVRDWFVAQMVPLLTTAVATQTFTATDQASASAPSRVLASAHTGTATGSAVANNTALVTSFRTAGRGRSSRGRNYVPGVSVTGASGTSVPTTLAASFVTAYGLLNQYLQLATQECYHTVVSHYLNGAPRTTGLQQQVLAYITNIDFDSQRRRLAGRGN